MNKIPHVLKDRVKHSLWWDTPLAKKFIPRSEFAKNLGILSFGTIVAQVISIIATPILTRLYKPTDYGTLSLFISISTIVVSFATLGYHAAIIIPKKVLLNLHQYNYRDVREFLP